MKAILIISILASLIFIGPSHANAAKVTQDEALKAAANWITIILNKKGSWGGSKTALVKDIIEFRKKGRMVGYFCSVEPKGFIIISLRRELEPVKAYSEDSNLDPESESGLADLIKGSMEKIIDHVEKKLGVLEKIQRQDLRDILEIDYSGAWDELIGKSGEKSLVAPEGGADALNYQESGVLLASSWHQGAPYNDQTPAGATCTHTVVGCVATAGAQIMRYWNWPPYGSGSPYNDTYDWPNMPDRAKTSSSAAERAAVAELSYEVGLAVGMIYGCGLSGSHTYDMEAVYENQYRYSTAAVKQDRSDYTAVNWFERIKAQFNANRPIHYRINEHSIVADGWQEIGATPTRQYHMNYGWDDGNNAWYTLDALYYPTGGSTSDEYIIENIYPAPALGSTIAGTYIKPAFPYRYFDQDANGSSATFESGQFLQFLHGIVLTNTSTLGGYFLFDSTDGLNTHLFARGNNSVGVKMTGGRIKMYQNGSVKFF